jgi:hypothetical protein
MGDSQPPEKAGDATEGQDAIKVSQARNSEATKGIGFGQKMKQNIPFILIMFKWVVEFCSSYLDNADSTFEEDR